MEADHKTHDGLAWEEAIEAFQSRDVCSVLQRIIWYRRSWAQAA